MKYFYEVIKNNDHYVVHGPIKNIKEGVRKEDNKKVFIQFLKNRAVSVWDKEEILVTNKPLVGRK